MGLWTALWKTPTTNWVYGILRQEQVSAPFGQQRIVDKDQAYVSITMRHMRVALSRKGWTAYSGAVHCFGELEYRGGDNSKLQLHSLATPVQLKDLAAKRPGRIEMRQQRLLGPVPYRGGDLALELGLFSVETDLAAPYLALLGKVAPLVGLPYISSALGIVDAFKDGIDNLGSQDHTSFEVGVANTFSEIRTGCYVLVAKPMTPTAISELAVDADGLLYSNNTLVTDSYVVFSIDATTTRDDYYGLPSVGAAYKTVMDEIRRRPPDKDRLQSALGMLSVEARLSPDLLRADAERIYAEAKSLIADLTGGTGITTEAATAPPVARGLVMPQPAGTPVPLEAQVVQPEWSSTASPPARAPRARDIASPPSRPCPASEAVTRARSLAGQGGQYELGTGDYRPLDGTDVPWTENGGPRGSDCAGFAISWCYKLPRHRPGYNRGAWATVSDDLNCNSVLEDAQHARELFVAVADAPRPGDLLLYPTIELSGHQFIGHVGIVIGCGRAGAFKLDAPDWSLLDIAQCCGPNGRAPAVMESDGAIWNHHDAVWPKPEHRSHLVRAVVP